MIKTSLLPLRRSWQRKPRSDVLCLVPVKQHVGKHGPNNCLGQAFVEAFRDLASEITNLRRDFEVERMEANDREARLVNKVVGLFRQLNAAQER